MLGTRCGGMRVMGAKLQPLPALAPESGCCQTSLCKGERSRAEHGKDCAVTWGGGPGLTDPVPHNGEQLTFPWDFVTEGRAASLLPGPLQPAQMGAQCWVCSLEGKCPSLGWLLP